MAGKLAYEEMEQRVKELEKETARRGQIEKTMRESEQCCQTIAESAKDHIFLIDGET